MWASDILRAAVVLLHATLEELLRSLARARLPVAPAASLRQISLVGTDREKFTIADLAGFRGWTVDRVIEESVVGDLDRSSYNHPGDVAEILAKIQIDLVIDKRTRDDLYALMDRRHLIAHQVDRNPRRGAGQPPTRRISAALVRRWWRIVEGVGVGILSRA